MKVRDRNPCPSCMRNLSGATGVGDSEGKKPRMGDISLCVYCGAVLTFVRNMSLALAGDDDLEGLEPDQRDLLARAAAAIRARNGGMTQ